eukprot:3074585-Prymnesium_polylepis.1
MAAAVAAAADGLPEHGTLYLLRLPGALSGRRLDGHGAAARRRRPGRRRPAAQWRFVVTKVGDD